MDTSHEKERVQMQIIEMMTQSLFTILVRLMEPLVQITLENPRYFTCKRNKSKRKLLPSANIS